MGARDFRASLTTDERKDICKDCPTSVKALGLLVIFGCGVGSGIVGIGWIHQYLASSNPGLFQEDFFQRGTQDTSLASPSTSASPVSLTPGAQPPLPQAGQLLPPPAPPAPPAWHAPAPQLPQAPQLPVSSPSTRSSSLPMEALQRHSGLYLDKSKAPELRNVLLLTSANIGYADMLQNWECHAKRLDLDWFVLAMDSKMFDHLGPERSFLVSGQQLESDARYGTKNFTVIACNKIRTVLSLIVQTGLDLVFTDCDNVFKRDPFLPQLTLGSLMRSGRYEYVYGRKARPPGPKREDYHKEPDKANTGFYYVSGGRKKPGVQHVFASGVQWCNKRPGIDDQENFWDSLVQIRKGRIKDKDAFKCFRHCGEKEDTVCAGHDESDVFGYCDISPWEYVEGSFAQANKNKDLVAYHANWVFGKGGKISKLKTVGLWNPTC